MDWLGQVCVPIVVTLLTLLSAHVAGLAWKRLRAKRAVIRLKLPPLPDSGLRMVLKHVRDGNDQVVGPGRPLNRDCPFRRERMTGWWRATTRFDGSIGFQFKCYVDYPAPLKDKVIRFLDNSGFVGIDKDETLKSTRLWFLLPDHPTCKTVDDPPYTNNYFHAGLREIVHPAEHALSDGRATERC